MDPLTLQIKEACRSTSARWAAILQMTGSTNWKVIASTGLVRTQQPALKQFLLDSDSSAWLCGAVSVGRCRWRNISAGAHTLPGKKLFLYPAQDVPAVILVGADEIKGPASSVWRRLASSLAAKIIQAESAPLQSSSSRSVRPLALVEQVQCTLSAEAPTAAGLEQVVQQIGAFYRDGLVNLQVSFEGRPAAFTCGTMPENAVVVVAPLSHHGQTLGSLAISLPQSHSSVNTDRLLARVLAAVLAAELARNGSPFTS